MLFDGYTSFVFYKLDTITSPYFISLQICATNSRSSQRGVLPAKGTTPSAEAAATRPKTGGETIRFWISDFGFWISSEEEVTTPSAEAAATPPKTGGETIRFWILDLDFVG